MANTAPFRAPAFEIPSCYSPDPEEVDDFLFALETEKTQNNWDDATAKKYFFLSLKSKALSWYRSDQDALQAKNWKDLKETFKKNFRLHPEYEKKIIEPKIFPAKLTSDVLLDPGEFYICQLHDSDLPLLPLETKNCYTFRPFENTFPVQFLSIVDSHLSQQFQFFEVFIENLHSTESVRLSEGLTVGFFERSCDHPKNTILTEVTTTSLTPIPPNNFEFQLPSLKKPSVQNDTPYGLSLEASISRPILCTPTLGEILPVSYEGTYTATLSKISEHPSQSSDTTSLNFDSGSDSTEPIVGDSDEMTSLSSTPHVFLPSSVFCPTADRIKPNNMPNNYVSEQTPTFPCVPITKPQSYESIACDPPLLIAENDFPRYVPMTQPQTSASNVLGTTITSKTTKIQPISNNSTSSNFQYPIPAAVTAPNIRELKDNRNSSNLLTRPAHRIRRRKMVKPPAFRHKLIASHGDLSEIHSKIIRHTYLRPKSHFLSQDPLLFKKGYQPRDNLEFNRLRILNELFLNTHKFKYRTPEHANLENLMCTYLISDHPCPEPPSCPTLSADVSFKRESNEPNYYSLPYSNIFEYFFL